MAISTKKKNYANRTVYCKNVAVWSEAQEIAGLMGTTLSDVIMEHLQIYITEQREFAKSIRKLQAKGLAEILR